MIPAGARSNTVPADARSGPAADAAAAEVVARRGRPRDEGVARAVTDAVLRMVSEGTTFGDLTMEGIAREAGVGKATVYRRWPNKDALLLDVIAAVDTPPPDSTGTGVLREDLIVAVDYIRRRSVAKRESAVMRSVLSQAMSSPVLWRRYHDTVIRARRQMLADLLRRGVESGEIRPELGADLDLLTDMVSGPILARAVLRLDAPLPDDLPATIVDTLLEGLRPRT